MKWLILFILFVPLGYSIEATISCPEDVVYEEEFVCDVVVSDVSDIYDLKVYIKGGGNGVNRIWDGGGWQRADWYVKRKVSSAGDYAVRLIIHKEFVGIGVSELKLRKTGASGFAYQESFEINIGKQGEKEINVDVEEKDEEEGDEEEPIKKEKRSEMNRKELGTDNYVSGRSVYVAPKMTPKKVINLNSHDVSKESQTTIYESKNERIMNYLVYGFIFFLICVIGILLYDKR